jgi:hypothetical protein
MAVIIIRDIRRLALNKAAIDDQVTVFTPRGGEDVVGILPPSSR